MEENSKTVDSQSVESLKLRNINLDKQLDKNMKPLAVQSDKVEYVRLGMLEEESEDETKSIHSSTGESDGNDTISSAKVVLIFSFTWTIIHNWFFFIEA